MAPRQRGETHTDAEGDRRRYRPRVLLGGGANGRMKAIMTDWECILRDVSGTSDRGRAAVVEVEDC